MDVVISFSPNTMYLCHHAFKRGLAFVLEDLTSAVQQGGGQGSKAVQVVHRVDG